MKTCIVKLPVIYNTKNRIADQSDGEQHIRPYQFKTFVVVRSGPTDIKCLKYLQFFQHAA